VKAQTAGPDLAAKLETLNVAKAKEKAKAKTKAD
jgi:hypothetical protein